MWLLWQNATDIQAHNQTHVFQVLESPRPIVRNFTLHRTNPAAQRPLPVRQRKEVQKMLFKTRKLKL